jgi:hypothetical protein
MPFDPDIPDNGEVSVDHLAALLASDSRRAIVLIDTQERCEPFISFNDSPIPIRCLWSDDPGMPDFVISRDAHNLVGLGWTAVSFCASSNFIAAVSRQKGPSGFQILKLASRAALC